MKNKQTQLFIDLVNKKIILNKIPKYANIYSFYIKQKHELSKSNINYFFPYQILNTLNNSKLKSTYIECLNKCKPEFFYKSIIHGIYHNLRVSIFTFYLCHKLKLNHNSTKISLYAALYHDIGRVNDAEDNFHGQRSSQMIDLLNLDLSNKDKQILKLIITAHSLPDEEFYKMISDNDQIDKKLCETLFKILKDSDALDRVRLPYPHVDLKYLRLSITKQMIPFSYNLFYGCNFFIQKPKLTSSVTSISREELFKLSNKFIFHGSNKLFDLCIPSQAYCNTGIVENRKYAVYGTSDIRFAICFALSKGIDTSWEVFEKESSYCAHIHSKTKFKNNKVGYLYLFDKKDFTNTREESIQFFCNHPVKPVKIYKILYKNYEDLFYYDD